MAARRVCGRALFLAVVSGAVVAAVPSAAGAALVGAPRFLPLAGPALAGPGVIWGEVTADGGMDLMEGRENATPRTIGRLPSVPSYVRQRQLYQPSFGAELAASAQRVAIEISPYPRPPDGGNLSIPFTAAIGSPLEPLSEGCTTGGSLFRAVSASGDVVTYRVRRRGGPCDDFVVADFGGGGSPVVVRLPQGAFLPWVAGRYVAYALAPDGTGSVERRAVEVMDRSTGGVVYRLEAAEMPGDVYGLSLSEDGTVVLVYAGIGLGPLRYGVAWASAAEPWVHGLLPPAGVRAARVVGDRVVVLSRPSLDASTGTLSLVGLDGSGRLLAGGVYALGDDRFDFDGRDVTWVVSRCDRAEILRAPLEGLPLAPERAGRRCPLVLTAPVWRASPTALRLRVSCAGLEPTCIVGAVSVRTRGRRPVVLVRRDFEQLGYGSSFAVLLTRAGRRLLARHRRLAVRISGYVGSSLLPRAGRPPLYAQLRNTTTVITTKR